jgi:hypothetical protein
LQFTVEAAYLDLDLDLGEFGEVIARPEGLSGLLQGCQQVSASSSAYMTRAGGSWSLGNVIGGSFVVLRLSGVLTTVAAVLQPEPGRRDPFVRAVV